MTNNANGVTMTTDPWREDQPVCRVYSHSPRFRQQLAEYVGQEVRFTAAREKEPREALIVDCTSSTDVVRTARSHFPTHPIVAVIPEGDPARVIELLSCGVEGVIALNDPPSSWREGLNVVLGGGRWVGGPGLDVSLEHKYASYGIATHDRHSGDVTMRTQLFVRNRLADDTGD